MPRVLFALLLLLVAVLPPSVQAAAGHGAHVTPLPYGTRCQYYTPDVAFPGPRPGWHCVYPGPVYLDLAPKIRHTPSKRAPKKAAARRTSAPRGRYSAWMLVTYYLATGSPMANGQMPYIGAAACGYEISLGTRVFVPGIGVLTCGDRMCSTCPGIPFRRHIDVFDIPLGTGYRLVTVY